MEKMITVDGLPVQVIRKRIKNAYLHVAPDGSVRMSAPLRMRDAEIRDLIVLRRGWLEKHRTVGRERVYETGGRLPLWGAWLPLYVVPAAKGGVRVSDGGLVMSVPADAELTERERIYAEFLRKELKKAMPDAIARGTQITGAAANEWRTRDMSTRWGSCNVEKKRIWLNVHLAEKPPRCLDYVVAHELCHLYERGHGKAFWARMDRYCPDWRSIRKLLNTKEPPCT